MSGKTCLARRLTRKWLRHINDLVGFGLRGDIRLLLPRSLFYKDDAMEYIVARLKEPSTWRGVAGLAAVFGIVISPELADAIMVAGLGVFSLIEVFRKEKVKKNG